MTEPLDPRTAGERVDRLLEQLQSSPDPHAAATAEELVRCLVRLYGAGLEHIVDMLGPDLVLPLCADPLVESLLLVHDLHPLDRDSRIRQALDRTQPRLDSTELDFLGVDASGVVHVRLTGGGRGCGSTAAATAEQAIAAAVADLAPETAGVRVEVVAAPPPLMQIGLRPGLRPGLEPGLRPGLAGP